ncbi:hypothetical protein [Fodinicola acaciae]|uniref:hypothetical protein n=1 Tax=Fodinicola acaciae TaxID=2681555 RepID=UPI0013D09104|nr:hypothetical protein [Fodinicola acaciae]
MPAWLALAIMRRRSARHQERAADLQALSSDTYDAMALFLYATSPYDALAPRAHHFLVLAARPLRELRIALARMCPLSPRRDSARHLREVQQVAGQRPPTWWCSGDRREELVNLATAIRADGPAHRATDETHLRIAGELLALTAARIGVLSAHLPRRRQADLTGTPDLLQTMSGSADLLHPDPPQPSPTAVRSLFPQFY